MTVGMGGDARTAVADLGRRALAGVEPPQLIVEAVGRVVASLGADIGAVERLLPDGALELAAVAGWAGAPVGATIGACPPESLCAAAVASPTPLLVADLLEDGRQIPAALSEQGLRSALLAAFSGGEGPYGVLAAYSLRPRAFSDEDAAIVGAMAGVLGDAIRRKHAEDLLRLAGERERRVRERLEAHSRLIVEAQEAERRRIARELHDEIGQTLTGLKLTLEGLERTAGGDQSAALGRAQALVAELMSRVDILSLDLRPAMLDDLGLLPALLWLVGRYYAQTGIRVAVEHSGLDRKLEPGLETAAYRIVQEALTNVARHADTTRASLRAAAEGDTFVIEVRDEGAGFDATAGSPGSLKFGLIGMEERARLVGGSLTVTSERGKGTLVVASLPLRQPNGAG